MHEEVKLNCRVINAVSFLQPQLSPFHYFTEKHSFTHHDVLSTLYTVQQQLLTKKIFLQAFLLPV